MNISHIENENSAYQRFIDKIAIDDISGCWNWQAYKDSRGYGGFNYLDSKRKGKCISSHIYSYRIFKGEILKGLCLDHLCRNPACCNPDHLQAVTRAENTRRQWAATPIEEQVKRVAKANKAMVENLKAMTHCRRGHERGDNNIYQYAGRKCCRACARIANNKRRLKDKLKKEVQ